MLFRQEITTNKPGTPITKPVFLKWYEPELSRIQFGEPCEACD
jgi:hypothetical protein